MKLERIRKDFPIFERRVRGKPIIYFDNAATSQKPRQVIQAMRDFYEKYCANVHRGIHSLSQEASEIYEAAHDKVARFLGARGREEIVFTKNVTEAINLVAYSLLIKGYFDRNSEIVLSEMEHHSNLVPWQLVARKTRAKLRFIQVREDGTLDIEDAKRKIDKKTKLVSIAHLSNFLGTINQVEEIGKLAHEVGAYLLVDSAQAVPHLPVRVKKLGCDFLGFTGHKMLGPTGIGGLYLKEEIAREMEPFLYGGDMISEVEFRKARWNILPFKFEAGTPPIAQAYGLSVAIDYLDRIGMERVMRYERRLTRETLKGLRGIEQVKIYGPLNSKLRGGLVSFNLGDLNPHDVATILDEKENIMVRSGHHCVMPLHRKLGLEGSVRASYYIYNTKEEVKLMIEIIKQIARTLI
jgi:cysteine desulfurase/selenocysteine lyase